VNVRVSYWMLACLETSGVILVIWGTLVLSRSTSSIVKRNLAPAFSPPACMEVRPGTRIIVLVPKVANMLSQARANPLP